LKRLKIGKKKLYFFKRILSEFVSFLKREKNTSKAFVAHQLLDQAYGDIDEIIETHDGTPYIDSNNINSVIPRLSKIQSKCPTTQDIDYKLDKAKSRRDEDLYKKN